MERSNVVGVGIDLVEIERMQRAVERSPHFVRRVFSPSEIHYCTYSRRPSVHYAGIFAAHEAVLKALGVGFSQGVGLLDVEVTHNHRGKPMVTLHNRARQIADQQGIIDVQISISNTHDLAVAHAVAITSDARPVTDDTLTTKAQLEASFKELRSVLDDLKDSSSQ